MLKKIKYFNQTLLDTPDLRVGISIVNKKKVPDKESDIELVFNTQDGLAVASSVYIIFAFKNGDGTYTNSYVSYPQLRAFKLIANALTSAYTNYTGSVTNAQKDYFLQTDTYGSSKESMTFKLDSAQNIVILELFDESKKAIAGASLSLQQFLAYTEVLEQVSLPAIQAAVGIAFSQSDNDANIQPHVKGTLIDTKEATKAYYSKPNNRTK
jgi:hypothetical protein